MIFPIVSFSELGVADPGVGADEPHCSFDLEVCLEGSEVVREAGD